MELNCFFGHKWELLDVKGIEKCYKCGKKRCKLSDFFTLEEKQFIKEQFVKLPHQYGVQAKNAAIDIVQKLELEDKVEFPVLELIKSTLDLIIADSMMNDRPQTREWGRNMNSIFDKIEKA